MHQLPSSKLKSSSTQIRERLEIAVNKTTDGIALLDNESKYYYLNKAHVQQFGYSKESELVGQTWHVIYEPAEIARIEKDIFPLLMRDGTWTGETVGVTKQGEPVQQEITLTVLEDGGMICVTRILTDLRKAEHALQARTETIASIIQRAPYGILLEDANRNIIEANPELGCLISLPLRPDDLRETSSIEGLKFVKEQMKEPEEFVKGVEALVKRKVPVFNEVIQLKNDSFLERDFIPLFTNEELQGYLWMYRDITEYEETKESLKGLVAKERELNEMRSKLVRTVSHEFKKPILNTLTGIQLLQGQLRNSGEGLYSKALDHIVEELQGLNESVSKLVKYEGLIDKTEPATKPVQVRNLITNYLHYHFKLFMLSEKFEIEDLVGKAEINIELNLFNLALKNVVENALKYTEYNEKIHIKSVEEDGQVKLSFSNPVSSKTKPDKNQLGTPLYRANPGDEKGLGLGLGIVQHVIGLLGGYVTYDVKEFYCITLVLPSNHNN